MKAKLNFDSRAGQFKCEVNRRKFYLGSDATTASLRKVSLVSFWQRCEVSGRTCWDAASLAIANSIRKGESIELRRREGENDDAYLQREAKAVRLIVTTAPVRGAITEADLAAATEHLLTQRNTELELLVRERLGEGAVQGPSITVHAALDAYHAYRLRNELDPDTGGPTEGVKVEGNYVRLAKRCIDPSVTLSRLSFTEIHQWCKALSNRPLSLKTHKPIARATVKNVLKLVRRFIKWAGRNYEWKRPDEWKDATLVMARRSKDERIAAKAAIAKYYTPEEIAILWKYATPPERFIIITALNFGFTQAELLALTKQDFAGEETVAVRGKSDVLGKWIVWPETRELARQEFEKMPRLRQKIYDRFVSLIERVRVDHPTFKKLPFKWLRKSGSSLIRKIAGGEVSSVYLSHGESASTDDELLEIYADTDWDGVCSAVRMLREKLLPHLQLPAAIYGYTPLSVQEKIRQGWEHGLPAAKIAKEVGTSKATVYRYRPVPAVT